MMLRNFVMEFLPYSVMVGDGLVSDARGILCFATKKDAQDAMDELKITEGHIVKRKRDKPK